MVPTRALMFVGLAFMPLCACNTEGPSQPSTPGSSGTPTVLTTFYPTAYFARCIAGEHVEIVCPVPPGEDPIFWTPDEATLLRYQKADRIILNGAEFEKWVMKVSLPESRLVNTARPLEKHLIRYESTTTHSHGPAGEHTHQGIDGHTWLDPWQAKLQAGEIHKAFQLLRPEHKARFDEGYSELCRDLDALDARLRELFPAEPTPLLASHPAYNYLARRHGWKLENLDLDPDTVPPDEVFVRIREILKTHPARIILWESAPRSAIAERFRSELGLTSVVFSPCELLEPVEEESGADYLTIMNRNVDSLRAALK